MTVFRYVLDRFYKINRMMHDFIEQDLNIFQRMLIVMDLSLSIIIYGCGITDYFQYQFYKRKHTDRKTFIVHRKRMQIVKICNDKKDQVFFNRKPEFNRTFKDYIGRKWIDTAICSFDDFRAFVQEVDRFMIKPSEGSHGIGIRIKTAREINSDPISLFNEIKAEDAIVEELIVQDEAIGEFNKSSVNTLRVVSMLCADGEVKIMSANLRMGTEDRYADNFHFNGIAALIDVETGLVITPGIDKNFKRYIIHPVSGKQIIGYKIPYWHKIIKTVKQVALIVPTVRYVGWDIAIGNDGRVILVEGNSAADPDVSQMPDQVGKWPLFEKPVKEIRSIQH
jgi:hypothetical protein